MIAKHYSEVEARQFEGEDARGVVIRPVISDADGAPTFALRYFEIEPQGYTPSHQHPWEHELFILSGAGVHIGPDGETPLSPGMAVFIPPGELHQFRNAGDETFTMTCSIPLRDETRGGY